MGRSPDRATPLVSGNATEIMTTERYPMLDNARVYFVTGRLGGAVRRPPHNRESPPIVEIGCVSHSPSQREQKGYQQREQVCQGRATQPDGRSVAAVFEEACRNGQMDQA